ncbi:MAG: hypothetical protein U9M98_00995 [Patescibacteria group bacterium]|nr:hypothetical protein [Patescibacteria group bacterium]
MSYSDFCELVGFPHTLVLKCSELSPRYSLKGARTFGNINSFTFPKPLSSTELLFWYSDLDTWKRTLAPTFKEVREALLTWLERWFVRPLHSECDNFWGVWLEEVYGVTRWTFHDVAVRLLDMDEIDYEGYVYAYLNCPFCTLTWKHIRDSYPEDAVSALEKFFPNGWVENIQYLSAAITSKLGRKEKVFLDGEISVPISRN